MALLVEKSGTFGFIDCDWPQEGPLLRPKFPSLYVAKRTMMYVTCYHKYRSKSSQRLLIWFRMSCFRQYQKPFGKAWRYFFLNGQNRVKNEKWSIFSWKICPFDNIPPRPDNWSKCCQWKVDSRVGNQVCLNSISLPNFSRDFIVIKFVKLFLNALVENRWKLLTWNSCRSTFKAPSNRSEAVTKYKRKVNRFSGTFTVNFVEYGCRIRYE